MIMTDHSTERLDQTMTATELERVRRRYLSLLQECLIGGIYRDPPLTTLGHTGFDEGTRDGGWDWPSTAHSMIGRKRMRNLCQLSERVIVDAVPGDFIETGVWRGGACILMRGVLEAYDDRRRRVWVADSFEGLPEPDSEAFPMDADIDLHKYVDLRVSIDEVQENFRRYGLLDDQVVFLKGWFRDTLAAAPIEQLAILRLDGDMYESTMDSLRALYGKVSSGGFVIVDDYNCYDACKQAVTDFCRDQGLSPEIETIDEMGVYWRKI